MKQNSDIQINDATITDDVLDKLLLKHLYRADCPDMMLLGEYHLGLLEGEQQKVVTDHLNKTRCPHCQAELEQLIDFLAEDMAETASTPSLAEAVWHQKQGLEWQIKQKGKLVIRFLKDKLMLAPTLKPTYAVRSGTSEKTLWEQVLTETKEDLTVTITATLLEDESNLCQLTIELDMPTQADYRKLRGKQVLLKKADEVIETGLLNPYGHVVFNDIDQHIIPEISLELPLSG